MNDLISGGISGAISNPWSAKARLHAIRYYEEVRHRSDDVFKIAKYTGYTPEQILKVKNFLFVETHLLITGIHRFDPSFEIAETWQRLSDMQEYVQPHDELLIPHELMEMDLINKGMSQEEAHRKTCEKYDYPSASNKFYKKLQREKKATIKKSQEIDGSKKKNKGTDWDMCL